MTEQGTDIRDGFIQDELDFREPGIMQILSKAEFNDVLSTANERGTSWEQLIHDAVVADLFR